MRAAVLAFALIPAAFAQETAKPPAELTGDIVGIHDPVIARERDSYYIYSTNSDAPPATLRIRSSKDLMHWTARGHVFEKLPDWAPAMVPGARGAWAPDIAFVNGRYLLTTPYRRSDRTTRRSDWRPTGHWIRNRQTTSGWIRVPWFSPRASRTSTPSIPAS